MKNGKSISTPASIAQYMTRDEDKLYTSKELKHYATALLVSPKAKSAYEVHYQKVSKTFSTKINTVKKILISAYGKELIKIYKPKKDGDGCINIIKYYKIHTGSKDDQILFNEMIEHNTDMSSRRLNNISIDAKRGNSFFSSLLEKICRDFNRLGNGLNNENAA